MHSRKKITLPTKGTCVVRKISGWDMTFESGELPVLFVEQAGRQTDANKARQIAMGVAVSRVALLKCCSPITTESGRRITIVNKPLDKCTEDEIDIGELDDRDAQAIIEAVTELTNMGKEVADKAKPFPEESKAPDSDSQSLQVLPQTSERPVEVAA